MDFSASQGPSVWEPIPMRIALVAAFLLASAVLAAFLYASIIISSHA
jgi:hypothetical protein